MKQHRSGVCNRKGGDMQKRFLGLIDYDNRGEIIVQEGRKFFLLKEGEWIECGLSVGYFLPEASEFECYEVITEEEALQEM